MWDRVSILLVTVSLVAVLASGCTSQPSEPAGEEVGTLETIYTHRWSYGPGYGGGTAMPVFEDTFDASNDGGELTVRIDWRIEQGEAAVELTPPSGERINWTSAETGGPQGEAERSTASEEGTWGFRIPTWRGPGGAFPSGHVEVRVLAPG